MNYEKLTPEAFTKRLAENVYESLPGARRAIGKAAWAEPAKERAREQALKHFGEAAPSTKAAPAKKVVTAVKKMFTAKPVAKAPKAKASPAKVKTPVAEAVKTPDLVGSHGVGLEVRPLTLADVRKNPFQTLQLAAQGVQAGNATLHSLTELRRVNPECDMTETTEAATLTVQASLRLISLVVEALAEGLASGKQPALARVLSNGMALTSTLETSGEASPIAEA